MRIVFHRRNLPWAVSDQTVFHADLGVSDHIPLTSPKVREVELLVQLHLATVASSLPWARRFFRKFPNGEEQGDLSTQFSDVKQRDLWDQVAVADVCP